MEERVVFSKGNQRRFFDLVIEKLNCISLRGILQYGFDISYSTLKNYYTERRLIPKSFFENLCFIAKVKSDYFKVEYIGGNWGQVKGGKISKRGKITKVNKKNSL
ncbi:MAG: hypothetical protein WC867_06190 [Candidatus Pacearchaeota archaeon]|jgi:hypothetical protein